MEQGLRLQPEKASAYRIYTVARNCIDMLRRKSNTQHLPLENEDFGTSRMKRLQSPCSSKRSEEKVQASLARFKEQDQILRKVTLKVNPSWPLQNLAFPGHS